VAQSELVADTPAHEGAPRLDLYWIPLGAGASLVRVCGRTNEALAALLRPGGVLIPRDTQASKSSARRAPYPMINQTVIELRCRRTIYPQAGPGARTARSFRADRRLG